MQRIELRGLSVVQKQPFSPVDAEGTELVEAGCFTFHNCFSNAFGILFRDFLGLP